MTFVSNLSRSIQFCPLPHQNFEQNATDPLSIPEPWVQEPKRFLPIFMGLRLVPQRNTLSYKTLYYGQSGTILRTTVALHLLPKSTFNARPDGPLDYLPPDVRGWVGVE